MSYRPQPTPSHEGDRKAHRWQHGIKLWVLLTNHDSSPGIEYTAFLNEPGLVQKEKWLLVRNQLCCLLNELSRHPWACKNIQVHSVPSQALLGTSVLHSLQLLQLPQMCPHGPAHQPLLGLILALTVLPHTPTTEPYPTWEPLHKCFPGDVSHKHHSGCSFVALLFVYTHLSYEIPGFCKAETILSTFS